jgi:hypothetical protein
MLLQICSSLHEEKIDSGCCYSLRLYGRKVRPGTKMTIIASNKRRKGPAAGRIAMHASERERERKGAEVTEPAEDIAANLSPPPTILCSGSKNQGSAWAATIVGGGKHPVSQNC